MLPSIGSEVLKAVVAQYNAESLLTKREEVSHAVRKSLLARAADFSIVLDDVSITHLSFSSEFTKAVESKQVAEQDSLRASFVVMKAEQVRIAAQLLAQVAKGRHEWEMRERKGGGHWDAKQMAPQSRER